MQRVLMNQQEKDSGDEQRAREGLFFDVTLNISGTSTPQGLRTSQPPRPEMRFSAFQNSRYALETSKDAPPMKPVKVSLLFLL